jgi:hypothetical protein
VTDNGMLDKVRKLMAQAEDSSVTPAEAEAFMERAIALMAKYGLDEALVNEKRAVREVPVTRKMDISGSYSTQKGEMYAWIVQAMRGKCVMHHSRKRLTAVTAIGFASDLDRAELVYTSLLLQAATQVAKVKPELNFWGDKPSASATAAYRRSWYRGFSTTVSTRIRLAEEAAVAQAEPEAAAQGASMELVLVDRSAQVQNAFEEAFPNLGKPRKVRVDRHAYHQGSAAGERADIGGKRLGGTRIPIGV